MTYPVIIRPEAEDEIKWAHEYYFALSTALGEDLRLSVVECIERTANMSKPTDQHCSQFR